MMKVEPIQLAFEEFGDNANTPLVILHGFFASSRNWRSIARTLSKQHHVYVLNLRNHGASAHSPIMDYPTMALDLQNFLQQHEIKKANLMGHSMGGKIAMWYALNFPEMINKLIVVDISPSRYKHNFDKTIRALMDLPLRKIKTRNEADQYLADTIPETSYRQFLLQNLQLKNNEYSWRVDLEVFQQTADNIVGFPLEDDLKPYKEAVLFLGGENSDYIKADDVYRFFPKAIISTIPNTAHWLHVQAPDQFCREVNAFLGGC